MAALRGKTNPSVAAVTTSTGRQETDTTHKRRQAALDGKRLAGDIIELARTPAVTMVTAVIER